MNFQVLPLSSAPFAHLYGRSDESLRAEGVIAYVADGPHGFPCRVTLEDAAEGERLLLLNFEHLPADSPYRSRHAIFVKDGAAEQRPEAGHVPAMLASRLLSVRSFDADDMMIDANVVEGSEAPALFQRMLGAPEAAYLHVHTARRGCYLARVERR